MTPALRFFFSLLFLLCPALAQEPAASATFEPLAGRVGRPVEYRVTITSDQRVEELPRLQPPDGLQFQPTGSTFSLSPLNGQLVGVSTLRFMVLPQRAGEFKVPSFDVDVGVKRVRVPESTLTVNTPAPGEAAYQPMRVVLEIPDREFYVGETVPARLLFLSTVDEAPQFVQHIAKTTGTVLFKPARLARPTQVMWEGKLATGLAMPVEITPMVEGESSVSCEALVQVGKIDSFGRRNMQSTVQSTPAKLRVLAVPKTRRPAGFTGAIGQYTMGQPKLSATEIQAGEPVTLSFAVTGEGNLESVPAPELEEVPNWTLYKPTSEFTRDDDSGRSTKTFTYTLVPKTEGRRGTPALPFAYFDPAKKEFVDLTIPPIPLVVTAAPGTAPVDPAVSGTAPRATDLPPAEPEPALTGLAEQSGSWTGFMGPSFRIFGIVQILPPLLLLLLWVWRRRSEYLAAHPEILLRRRARTAARRALVEARAAARRDDVPAFLRAGAGALCEAAAHIDTARPTSLTPSEVLLALDGDAAQAARQIFDHAEATRYASAAGTLPKPSALLPGLENAVSALTSRA